MDSMESFIASLGDFCLVFLLKYLLYLRIPFGKYQKFSEKLTFHTP